MLRTCLAAGLALAVFGFAATEAAAGGLPGPPPEIAPETEEKRTPEPEAEFEEEPEAEFMAEPDFPPETFRPVTEDFMPPAEEPPAPRGRAARARVLLAFIGAVTAALILIRILKGGD